MPAEDFDPRGYAETWEAFSQFLRACRHNILDAILFSTQADGVGKLYAQISKLEGPEGQVFIDEVQEVWERLGTTENRFMALSFISFGVTGRIQSLLEGKNVSIKNQKVLYNRERKAHRQVEKAGQQLVAALETYEGAAVAVEREGPYPFLAFLKLGRGTEAGQQVLAARRERVRQITLGLKAARDLREQLQRVADNDAVLKSPGHERGRRANDWINMAINGLENLLVRCCHLKTYPAQQCAHALLYAAGVWSDENSQGFTAKAYQIRTPKK